MEPLVCILLVNYNGLKDTIECVQSLLNIVYKNYKIIIVDNASNDREQIKNCKILSENTDIILSKNNLGFAGGNNLGIKYAEKYNPQYYLLINNDTIVDRYFLNHLISMYETKSCVGIVTGKIFYYDNPTILGSAGGYFDEKTGNTPLYGMNSKDALEYNNSRIIQFATGCLWLVSKNIFDIAGYMDDSFFLYYEDSDYCLRLNRQGLNIWYCPKAVIYHKESQSTIKGSKEYQYYNLRNQLVMIKRHCLHKNIAFLKKTYKVVKDIIRKRRDLSVTLKAYHDYFFHVYGKQEIK